MISCQLRLSQGIVTQASQLKSSYFNRNCPWRSGATQGQLHRELETKLPLNGQFYVWGEEVRRSIEWLIKRLIMVGARVSYHARRWYVHVASAFPLAHHYQAVLEWGS